MYEPHDYLALYGKDPLNDFQLGGQHWVATGDSGQAMTGAALAAMVIGNEILGTANEFGEVLGTCLLHAVLVSAGLPRLEGCEHVGGASGTCIAR